MIQQLLDLIQFHQGLNRSQSIDIGVENVLLDLQKQWVVQLDETQLHTVIGFLGSSFFDVLAGVRLLQNT